MKKLLFAAIAATLVSCSYEAYDIMYYTDFTKYAQKGMFVSSIADFNGTPYVALGDVGVQAFDSGDFVPQRQNGQQVLDKVVDAARQRGANGVIGYSSRYMPSSKAGRGYWYATGVAVRFEKQPGASDDVTPTAATPAVPNKMYDFAKAESDLREKNITAVAFTKTDHEKVYYDPEIGKYNFPHIIERKYGADVLVWLENFNAKRNDDIAAQTVDYLISNKMRFDEWQLAGNAFFDISEKKYIPKKDWIAKYGAELKENIEQRLHEAKSRKNK